MCDICFYASEFQLPSGENVCGQCFDELFCRSCWQQTNIVGERIQHNGVMMCVTCVNNTPPIEENVIQINAAYAPGLDAAHEDEIQFGDFDIYDTPPNDIIYNIAPINDIYNIVDEIVPNAPPAGFDMNAASLVEHNPDYMNNLINAQTEYEGNWYFAFNNQIYMVPYEIEIDDDYVRQDIVESWDDVRWVGSIFGEYIAWL